MQPWMEDFHLEVEPALRWAYGVATALPTMFDEKVDAIAKTEAMRSLQVDFPAVVKDGGAKTRDHHRPGGGNRQVRGANTPSPRRWYFTDFAPRKDDVGSQDTMSLVDLLSEELLKHVKAVSTAIAGELQPKIAALKASLDTVVPLQSYVASSDIEDSAVYTTDLQILEAALDTDEMQKLMCGASDVGETGLKEQLMFLLGALQLGSATARTAIRLVGANHREDSCLSNDMVPFLLKVRGELKLMRQRRALMTQDNALKLFDKGHYTSMHIVTDLDGLVNAEVWIHRLEGEASRLLENLYDQCESDCGALADNVLKWCPSGWHLYADSLLDQGEIVKALLTNVNYTKIGPGVDILKKMRKAAKDVASDGNGHAITTIETAKKSQHAIEHGSLTVAMTYAAFQVTTGIPKIGNATARIQAVTDLRAALKPKVPAGMSIGNSIEDAMKKLEMDGTS